MRPAFFMALGITRRVRIEETGDAMDVDGIVAAMTPHERASLLAGASHWSTVAFPEHGLPAVEMSDGPHGLRHQTGAADHLGINASDPAVCYPTASALACSFDVELVEEVGRAIGEEARDQGVHVVLGPGVNMKRSPLCGRNFEYFSEDPLLAGELGAAMVRGIQGTGVAACVKHFAANNQEHARQVSNSVVDERALREVYLAPFEHIVRRSAPWSVMTAYNRLNGTYCSEHPWLLHDVLRGEWGFDGVCISDWGAVSDVTASVAAGLDLCMPGPRDDYAATLEEAVAEGRLPQESVDAAAMRVVRLAARVHDAASPANGRSSAAEQALPAVASGLELARRAAARSAVLLENDRALPLAPSARIALIGEFAVEPRYQGAGSSKINPVALDNLYDELNDRGCTVSYTRGYDRASGATSSELVGEAVETAAASDVAVVVTGLPDCFESEGFDRKLMVMPRGMNELIERVAAAAPRCVVVLQGGAPMELPWRHRVDAILLAYLAGCRGGAALADLLLGAVSPSGKLAETWPARLEDTPLGAAFPDFDNEVRYRESVLNGYRFYDAAGVEPAYPFGHGLSYSSFAYENAELVEADGAWQVVCRVRNTGDCPARDVVQLYVAARDSPVYRERQRLASFASVELAAGEAATVRLPVEREALRVWDAGAGAWRVLAGRYELRVASSSRDVRACIRLDLVAGPSPAGDVVAPAELSAEMLAPVDDAYIHPRPRAFDDEAFSTLPGVHLPPRRPVIPFTIDSTVADMNASPFGRLVLRLIDRVMRKPMAGVEGQTREMISEIVADMPLRSLTSSGVSMRTVEGLVFMLNGCYLRGLRRIVAFWLKARRELAAQRFRS